MEKEETMENIRDKIYDYLAGFLMIEDFARWLYTDSWVNENVKDEFVFELLLIDLKSQHAVHELEKFAFERFGSKECLLKVIELNAVHFLEQYTLESANHFLKNTTYLRGKYKCDFLLLMQIDAFDDDWSLYEDGYFDGKALLLELSNFLKTFMEELPIQGIALLDEGIKVKIDLEKNPKKTIFQRLKFW